MVLLFFCLSSQWLDSVEQSCGKAQNVSAFSIQYTWNQWILYIGKRPELSILSTITEYRNLAQRIHFQTSALDPDAWNWRGQTGTYSFLRQLQLQIALASFTCLPQGAFCTVHSYPCTVSSCRLLTLALQTLGFSAPLNALYSS